MHQPTKAGLVVMFEEIKAEIATLLAQLAEHPHDHRELEVMLREKLSELKAFGMPLPDDLVELETALVRRLSADAKVRARYSMRRHRG